MTLDERIKELRSSLDKENSPQSNSEEKEHRPLADSPIIEHSNSDAGSESNLQQLPPTDQSNLRDSNLRASKGEEGRDSYSNTYLNRMNKNKELNSQRFTDKKKRLQVASVKKKDGDSRIYPKLEQIDDDDSNSNINIDEAEDDGSFRVPLGEVENYRDDEAGF